MKHDFGVVTREVCEACEVFTQAALELFPPYFISPGALLPRLAPGRYSRSRAVHQLFMALPPAPASSSAEDGQAGWLASRWRSLVSFARRGWPQMVLGVGIGIAVAVASGGGRPIKEAAGAAWRGMVGARPKGKGRRAGPTTAVTLREGETIGDLVVTCVGSPAAPRREARALALRSRAAKPHAAGTLATTRRRTWSCCVP